MRTQKHRNTESPKLLLDLAKRDRKEVSVLLCFRDSVSVLGPSHRIARQRWRTGRRLAMFCRLFERVGKPDQTRLAEGTPREGHTGRERVVDRRRRRYESARHGNTRIAGLRRRARAAVRREEQRIEIIGRALLAVGAVVDGIEGAARPDEVLRARVEILRRRSEEHTSELQSQSNLVCRLLLEKK